MDHNFRIEGIKLKGLEGFGFEAVGSANDLAGFENLAIHPILKGNHGCDNIGIIVHIQFSGNDLPGN